MLLQTVIIPEYLRKVKISESREPKYYSLGSGKLAKKYQDKRYMFKARTYKNKLEVHLYDRKKKEFVIANPKSVGTAKYTTINSQLLYSASISPFERAKIMAALKASMVPYVEQLSPISINDLPIRIEAEMFYTIMGDGTRPYDLDNHFGMYQKAFLDVLQGNKNKDGFLTCKQIIPEDHNLVIQKPPAPLFIPIEKKEDRKLVFKIYKETDPRIIEMPERIKLFDKYIRPIWNH